MLVLCRRLGEVITIPSIDMRVTVIGIGSGRVKLGIEAPKSVDVYREEVEPKKEASPDANTH
jgi:carbon storage regulator